MPDSLAIDTNLVSLNDSLGIDTVIANSEKTLSEPFLFFSEPQANDTVLHVVVENNIAFPENAADSIFYGGDWLAAVFFVLAVGLALLSRLAEGYIGQLIKGMFNYQWAHKIFRNSSGVMSRVSIFFTILYVVTISIFAFEIGRYFDLSLSKSAPFIEFIIILGLSTVLVFLRRIALRFVGFVFDKRSEFAEYIYSISLYNQVFAVFLLPLAFFIPYISGLFILPLLIFAGFLLVFSNLVRIIRGFKIISSKVFFIFYLILYFCTLEIIPILILYKIFKSLV